MSEIGIKDQCFGVEVEMTGITRRQAAEALASVRVLLSMGSRPLMSEAIPSTMVFCRSRP